MLSITLYTKISITKSFYNSEKPIDIFGFPKFQCEFSVHEDTEAMLALKMCDVFPNGSCRLITNGVLNLSHIASNENPKPLRKNTFYTCTILLDAAILWSTWSLYC